MRNIPRLVILLLLTFSKPLLTQYFLAIERRFVTDLSDKSQLTRRLFSFRIISLCKLVNRSLNSSYSRQNIYLTVLVRALLNSLHGGKHQAIRNCIFIYSLFVRINWITCKLLRYHQGFTTIISVHHFLIEAMKIVRPTYQKISHIFLVGMKNEWTRYIIWKSLPILSLRAYKANMVLKSIISYIWLR